MKSGRRLQRLQQEMRARAAADARPGASTPGYRSGHGRGAGQFGLNNEDIAARLPCDRKSLRRFAAELARRRGGASGAPQSGPIPDHAGRLGGPCAVPWPALAQPLQGRARRRRVSVRRNCPPICGQAGHLGQSISPATIASRMPKIVHPSATRNVFQRVREL